jgi:type II secretory pathway pseudopilin PulG
MITRRRSPAAFTLVEAIASIVIISTLGSLGSLAIYQGVDAIRTGSTQQLLHSQASQAMETLVREIRSVPIVSGSPDIRSVTASSINVAGRVYAISSGKLVMTGSEGSADLLPASATIALAGFDASNSPVTLSGTPNWNELRRLEITLSITSGGITETLRPRVFIRATMQGVSS